MDKPPVSARRKDVAARLAKVAAQRRATPKDLKDPVTRAQDKDLIKTRQPGQICVNGVCAADVEQGAIADCYLVSGLASVADAKPQVLRDAIKDNGDGSYRVRLYDKSGAPKHVTIDGQLYSKNGGLHYGKGTDRKELWVPLMEKAYAKMNGGYEAIGNGGNGGTALTAITGKPSEYVTNRSLGSDALYARLREATEHRRPMTANTFSKGDTKKDKAYGANGLSSWHVYSVLGAGEQGGDRYVTLRNPWASNEYSNPGYVTDVDRDGDGALDGDDGVFRMKLSDFRQQFRGAWVNDPPPKPSWMDRVGATLGLW